jgi:hypothetical protein
LLLNLRKGNIYFKDNGLHPAGWTRGPGSGGEEFGAGPPAVCLREPIAFAKSSFLLSPLPQTVGERVRLRGEKKELLARSISETHI